MKTTQHATRRFGVATLTLGAALLASAAFVPSAGAAENPTVFEGNLDCEDLGYDGELKFNVADGDPQVPAEGTYAAADDGTNGIEVKGDLPDGFYVEISDVETVGEGQDAEVHFVWATFQDDGDDEGDEADPSPVVAVLVKAGNGGLQWTYPEGETTDEAWSDRDSISHVTFCVGDIDTTTSVEDTTSSIDDTTTTEETTTTIGSSDFTPEPSVEGEVINRPAPTLPRTGISDMLPLIEAGVALMLLGLGMLRYSKRALV